MTFSRLEFGYYPILWAARGNLALLVCPRLPIHDRLRLRPRPSSD